MIVAQGYLPPYGGIHDRPRPRLWHYGLGGGGHITQRVTKMYPYIPDEEPEDHTPHTQGEVWHHDQSVGHTILAALAIVMTIFTFIVMVSVKYGH